VKAEHLAVGKIAEVVSVRRWQLSRHLV